MTNLFFISRKIYNHLRNKGFHIIPVLFLLFCKIVNRYYNSGIPINENINKFTSPHGFSGIFISKSAKIGKNCTIFQQVTIGINDIKNSKNYGAPIIGDNVYIGAGAKIIGNVKIGNNVKVGANCVVTQNVPDASTIVLQNPRILIKNSK